jgi:hypothetical protein
MKNIFFLLMLFHFDTQAEIFGPSNYEDCVLAKLKDAKTDLAVRSVYAMCANKFPSTRKKKFPKLESGLKVSLICTVYPSSRGMWFEISIKTREFNSKNTKGKITALTQSMLMAEINDDYFKLDLSSGSLDLESGGKRVLSAECEEEIK